MGIDKPMDLKHKCCFQIRRRISFIYLTLKIRKKFDSTNLTFVRSTIPIYKELFDLIRQNLEQGLQSFCHSLSLLSIPDAHDNSHHLCASNFSFLYQRSIRNIHCSRKDIVVKYTTIHSRAIEIKTKAPNSTLCPRSNHVVP